MAAKGLLADVRVRVGLLVCTCFLLTSTGWLSWLYRIMAIDAALPADAITMVAGYLLQAVGVGAYMLVTRRAATPCDQRLLAGLLACYIALLFPSTMLDGLAVTLAAGLLSNVVCGAIQGYYLCMIASFVEPNSQGTVFGCSYAASTLLSWLLSIPAAGALSRGLPCLLACLVMAAGAMALAYGLDQSCDRDEVARDAYEGPAPVDVGGMVRLACAVVLLASFVKTAGFSFPAADISAGVNIELSRLLYGCGLVVAGIASDRDRHLGFFCCAAALVMPFLMLALSGAGATGVSLWLLAYFLTGFYAVFRVLLAMDVSRQVDLPLLAATGLLFGRVGDALGTGLYLWLGSRPVVLIVITTIAFIATMALILAMYQRLYDQDDYDGQPDTSLERSERARFESFCQRYALTQRERDVLRLVLEEKSNPEIAGELVVSEATVKYHVSNLLKKTGCKNRLEVLAAYAQMEQ